MAPPKRSRPEAETPLPFLQNEHLTMLDPAGAPRGRSPPAPPERALSARVTRTRTSLLVLVLVLAAPCNFWRLTPGNCAVQVLGA
ncbi:MAG: hypothetical protein JXQ29_17395 [Planctomycetes bacterium]|nr:hypothetical protein [Planctomycetota bacterium]